MYRHTEHKANHEDFIWAWNMSDAGAQEWQAFLFARGYEPVRAFYGQRGEELDIAATACALLVQLPKPGTAFEDADVCNIGPYCIYGEAGEVVVRGIALWVRQSESGVK